jgi:flavin-dependent dehydrogenase
MADVFVIGGGPAGLAAAIAARRTGLSVMLADAHQPPIDKACGEGLLPDAVAALESLGVPLDIGYTLRGIRFCCGPESAAAEFPGRKGRGVRRLELHNLLRTHAEEAGVNLRWGTPVRNVEARWIVGADGSSSLLRKRAEIRATNLTPRRYACRQHYRIEPWTDYVEVHWGDRSQIYVTPVAEDEVGVALITSDPRLRLDAALGRFPELIRRLGNAAVISRMRGAVTATTRLSQVTAGNLALAGDASGTVDAITGEGIGLAFRQSVCLADALKRGNLAHYERKHPVLAFRPRTMSRVLLALDRHPQLLRWSVRMFAGQPATFRHLLALHVGR